MRVLSVLLVAYSLAPGRVLAHFAVVQLLSCIQLFATPWTASCWDSLSFTTFWSLLRHMLIESMLPSTHLILCHPLLLLPFVEIKNWWLSELGSCHLDYFQIISFVYAKHLFPSTCHGLQLIFTSVVTFYKTQCCRCSILEYSPRTSIHISGLAWWGWLDSWLRDSDLGSWDRRKNFNKRKLGANINSSKSLKWKPMQEGFSR